MAKIHALVVVIIPRYDVHKYGAAWRITVKHEMGNELIMVRLTPDKRVASLVLLQLELGVLLL